MKLYKLIKHNFIAYIIMVICILLIANTALNARQFRTITPIASPAANKVGLPEGAVPVDQPEPVAREEVQPMLQELIAKWNTLEMADTLSEEFYDKSRLMDVMDTGVPRNAKLRLQSIQGVQTLQQYIVPDSSGGRGEQVSIVSATARTQLEFNSSTSAFVSLPGTNEFILEITNAAPVP